MSLPSQTEIKYAARLGSMFSKQGGSILIMSTSVWFFYSMFQDQVKVNTQNMEEMRKDIKECNDYTRTVLTEVVERNTITMEKVIESMERLENKK